MSERTAPNAAIFHAPAIRRFLCPNTATSTSVATIWHRYALDPNPNGYIESVMPNAFRKGCSGVPTIRAPPVPRH
jgi:hypothetical protein